MKSGVSVCVLGAGGVSGCVLVSVLAGLACACMLVGVCNYVGWRARWMMNGAGGFYVAVCHVSCCWK